MKKILFAINTLGVGGAEKALIALLNRLEKEDVEIDLVVILSQGNLVADIPGKVNIINKKIDSINISGKGAKLCLVKNVLKIMFRRGAVFVTLPYLLKQFFFMIGRRKFQLDKLLWKTMALGAERSNKEYDLAVAFTEGASTHYVSNYVSAKRKASFLHITYEKSGYTRSIDDNCFDKIDRIFCVSQEVIDGFCEVYPEYCDKTREFNNLIDVKKIEDWGAKGQGFDDEFTGKRILTVGRLSKQKTTENAIEALDLLLKDNYNARWYVLGEGYERKRLEGIIKDKGLEDKFILKGCVDNPYPYILQSDLYVNASAFEGKSIAIQEAQLLKTPVIATRCAGNLEQIIDGVDGVLAQNSPRALADEIERLIDNPDLAAQMAEKSYEKVCGMLRMRDEEDILSHLFE